jgi:hypothetical protein
LRYSALKKNFFPLSAGSLEIQILIFFQLKNIASMPKYQTNAELIDQIVKYWENHPIEIARTDERMDACIHRFGLSLFRPMQGDFIVFQDLLHFMGILKEVDSFNFDWRSENIAVYLRKRNYNGEDPIYFTFSPNADAESFR